MLGSYIKSRGTRATEMSSNAALVTMETYVEQGETIWKLVFHIRAKMLKKMYILGNFFFRKTILSHFTFYAIFNINKIILKSAPSLTG